MPEGIQPQSAGHAAFLEARAKRVSSLRDRLRQAFADAGELVLEVGCGHGHYLTAYAQQHPDEHCLGIDLVTKRIEKAELKRDKRGLQRLHFFKADVGECLEAWPPQLGLGRIFILFPDPWPKKRHTKNRILQSGLLEDLAGLAAPGTPLHFRTDDPDNFECYFQDLFEGHYSLTALRVPS
jgi:tRNA (guanine-N7-)-methyltransferase